MKIETRSVEALIKDPANARLHSKENIEAIKGSLTKFGQQKPIVVNGDGVVIAGNGTLEAARALGWAEINCVVTELDSLNQTAFALADNRAGELASWDDEALGRTLHELREIDFDLAGIGFDTSYLDNLMNGGDGSGSGSEVTDKYTNKIKAPIYEPTGEKPSLEELFDPVKTENLVNEIATSPNISPEIKNFLIKAASRHTVFNYEKIAEYYAHASADVQSLMEKSALVIIDFDKAIENGFVNMTQKIADAFVSDPFTGEEEDADDAES